MARIQNGMRPVHPGEFLREDYLGPLGITANALAKALGVPTSRINDIALERRGITADTALRLARYFGGDAQTWLSLQATYDLKVAQRDHGGEIEKRWRCRTTSTMPGKRPARCSHCPSIRRRSSAETTSSLTA